jgi:hypothetical protein
VRLTSGAGLSGEEHGRAGEREGKAWTGFGPAERERFSFFSFSFFFSLLFSLISFHLNKNSYKFPRCPK